MKINLITKLRLMILSILVALPTASALAQDAKIDVDVTKSSSSTSFMAGPWVWIIGAAVFILILAAILTNRNRAPRD